MGHPAAMSGNERQCAAMCGNVRQCVAMCGNVRQCAAMCSNVQQYVAILLKSIKLLCFQMPGQSLIDLHVQIQKFLNRLVI